MTFKNLLLVRKDSIAILTLNRPDVLSALNSETISELVTCIRELLSDDLIRVIRDVDESCLNQTFCCF